MTETSTADIEAVQRAVEQRLGQCLLRLQAYEGLLKAIAADHELSGNAKTALADLKMRKTAINGKKRSEHLWASYWPHF